MTMNRRELCSLIPAVLLSTAFADNEAKLTSSTFPFEGLHAHKVNDTAESRSIVNGTTPTGERVEVHETRLNPGGAPHPPHSDTRGGPRSDPARLYERGFPRGHGCLPQQANAQLEGQIKFRAGTLPDCLSGRRCRKQYMSFELRFGSKIFSNDRVF